MAILLLDPCAISTLTSSGKCFDCLSKSEKQQAIIFFMAQALLALGGTDYTNVNVLNNAAACFACESDGALDSFEVVIAQEGATNAGAPTFTISELRAALKCWSCMDAKAIRAAYILLLCKLTQKEAPILL